MRAVRPTIRPRLTARRALVGITLLGLAAVGCAGTPQPRRTAPVHSIASSGAPSDDETIDHAWDDFPECDEPRIVRWLDRRRVHVDVCGEAHLYVWRRVRAPAPARRITIPPPRAAPRAPEVVPETAYVAAAASDYPSCQSPAFAERAAGAPGAWVDVCGVIRLYEPTAGGRLAETEASRRTAQPTRDQPEVAAAIAAATAQTHCSRITYHQRSEQGGVWLWVCGTYRHYVRQGDGTYRDGTAAPPPVVSAPPQLESPPPSTAYVPPSDPPPYSYVPPALPRSPTVSAPPAYAPPRTYSPSPDPGYGYRRPGRVHVRGYYRRDGTYVSPHTRRYPRRR